MAGDWIKFEKSTLDKPEVFEIAGILGIDPDAVIGKLLRVWNWFDDQSIDGCAPVTLAAQLNRNTGCAGFTQAMQQVGWMEIGEDRLRLPNFHRHNGETAKQRALSAKRMQKSRLKCYADSATSGATKTQPEKRREEKSTNTPLPPLQDGKPLCTIEQAKGQAPTSGLTEQEAEYWWHSRNSAGWTKATANGGHPRKITSWQSDMATSVEWIRANASKNTNQKPKWKPNL